MSFDWRDRVASRRGSHAELWREHFAAMNDGHFERASRIARKIFGIHGPPMPEEVKKKLASPEYKARAAARRAEKAAIAKRLRIAPAEHVRRKR